MRIDVPNEYENKEILVALSGGLDSCVLLDLILKHQTRFKKVSAIHINYQLRGQDSENDFQFTKELCSTHKIKLHHKISPLNPLTKNLQSVARKIRYDFFRTLAKRNSILVTAHHLDDQLETIIMRLIQGCSLRGLRGILSKRTDQNLQLWRPLLAYSKKDILSYATAQKLSWREDQSNFSDKYLRNNIRLNFIPQLTQSERSNFLRLGTMAQEFYKTYEEQVLTFIQSHGFSSPLGWHFSRPEFLKLSSFQQSFYIEWIYKNFFQLSLKRVQILSVQKSLQASLKQSKLFHFNKKSYLYLNHKELLFSFFNPMMEKKELLLIKGLGRYPLPWGGQLEIKKVFHPVKLDQNHSILYLEKLPHKLCLRYPHKKDKIHFIHSQESKDLIRFLKKQGLNAVERSLSPLLSQENGIILSILGLRHFQSVPQSTDSNFLYKLEYQKAVPQRISL